MKLARVVHLDESDRMVFFNPAQTGEWAISGGFEFSNWSEGDLTGKARQAFANGWLGIGSFGRATLVAVAQIDRAEYAALEQALAQHFVTIYGAPSLEAALPVATEEIGHMADLCAEHDANTLLNVQRDLTDAGVREVYRAVQGADAILDQVAMHGDESA